MSRIAVPRRRVASRRAASKRRGRSGMQAGGGKAKRFMASDRVIHLVFERANRELSGMR
jgi:hypothetical protein